MKIRILFRCALAALWLGLAGVQPAWAQAYPDRPVRLLMSFSAGSGVDTFGRLVAQKLADRLGEAPMSRTRAGRAASSASARWPRPCRTATRSA